LEYFSSNFSFSKRIAITLVLAFVLVIKIASDVNKDWTVDMQGQGQGLTSLKIARDWTCAGRDEFGSCVRWLK